ncbi:MAG: Hsp70 family protein [Myxococcota bacterium]
MSLKLGIDLGTTYSAVSHFEDGEQVETLDFEQSKMLPSVVYYETAEDPPVVGTTAVHAMMVNPELVVRHIKKHIGKTDYRTDPIHGQRYTPEEVSAEILRTLVRQAEQYLAETAKDVVITVPAYFGDRERAATEEAGKLAGLNVLGILSEPHAASLVYALEERGAGQRGHFLVYDLGGGTADITLIRAPKKQDSGRLSLSIETIAKRGRRIGGTDWDQALFDRVDDLAKREFGADLRSDPRVEMKVLMDCESAKRKLSDSKETSIVTDQVSHMVKITRGEFEEATKHLLLDTQILLEEVVEEGQSKGVARDDFAVVLVGGSTKMPMVSAMIKEVTGEEPLTFKNVDLLVTQGAAYYAHIVDQERPVVNTRKRGRGASEAIEVEEFVDITTRPIGIETIVDDAPFNHEIIPVGAEFGKNFARTFGSSEDDMTEIPVVLYEGPEVSNPAEHPECDRLLECRITGLPTGRPRGARVEVTLQIDKSGILRGTAVDQETGNVTEIVMDRSGAK